MDGCPPQQRACDRCHNIKERCRWVHGYPKCDRCFRLNHICQKNRPTRKRGRRPFSSPDDSPVGGNDFRQDGLHRDRIRVPGRHYQPPSLDSKDTGYTCPEESSGGEASITSRPGNGLMKYNIKMSTAETEQIRQILFSDCLLENFILGPSFCESMRQYLIPRLFLSKTVLQDGFLAGALSWTGTEEGCLEPDLVDASFRHASSALASLGSLKVTDFETMSDCLMLGVSLINFALKHRVKDVHTICCQTLVLMKPFYDVHLSGASDPLGLLTCMTLWDISGSVLQSKIPTLRFCVPQTSTDQHVDRYLGICVSLIPLLQDICEISAALLCVDADDAQGIFQTWHELEDKVQQWRPATSQDLHRLFNAIEVSHMLCQAQVWQQAALLILHRLRHPYGTNDEPARVLSKAILTNLDMIHLCTRKAVKHVELAFLVACLEVEARQRRQWLQKVRVLVGYSAQFQKDMQDTITSIWRAQDRCKTMSWGSLSIFSSGFLRSPTVQI